MYSDLEIISEFEACICTTGNSSDKSYLCRYTGPALAKWLITILIGVVVGKLSFT